MEKLKYKFDKFEASLKALGRSIEVFSRKDIPNDIKEDLIASVIKHFEICYETSWKFLKLYLQKTHEIEIDSPKKVFRRCHSIGLLNEATTIELLDINESRNVTTHDYDSEKAQKVFKRINNYYSTFKTLEATILKNLSYEEK